MALRRLTQSLTVMSSAVSAVRMSVRPTTTAAAIRFASSSSSSTPPKSPKEQLLESLRGEINYEKENFDPKEHLIDTIGDFSVQQKAGSTLMVLENTAKDYHVSIRLNINDAFPDDEYNEDDDEEEEEEEEEEDSAPKTGIEFHMVVTNKAFKNGPSMHMKCDVFAPNYLRIEEVYFAPKDATPEASKEVYKCAMDFLDDDLVDEIHSYLASLGVDGDFTENLLSLARNKERAEYQRWLSTIKDLVSSGKD